jgi:large subunit ribosomal protein L15
MAQKNRKVTSKRGSRSCGYGSAQKHRGSGSRGGRGKAGNQKHKQIATIQRGRTFGKVGFKRHSSLKKKLRTINLSDIARRLGSWVEEGKAKKTSGGYSVDLSALGYDKVLGGGNLSQKIEITADSFSASAKEKIEKAGGKAISGDDVDTV